MAIEIHININCGYYIMYNLRKLPFLLPLAAIKNLFKDKPSGLTGITKKPEVSLGVKVTRANGEVEFHKSKNVKSKN